MVDMSQGVYVAEPEIMPLAEGLEPAVGRGVIHRQTVFLHEQPVGIYPLAAHQRLEAVLLGFILSEQVHYIIGEF